MPLAGRRPPRERSRKRIRLSAHTATCGCSNSRRCKVDRNPASSAPATRSRTRTIACSPKKPRPTPSGGIAQEHRRLRVRCLCGSQPRRFRRHQGRHVRRQARCRSQHPHDHMLNSNGATGEPAIWGKPADWVDYSGTVGGKQVGVVAFDHLRAPASDDRHARVMVSWPPTRSPPANSRRTTNRMEAGRYPSASRSRSAMAW